MTDESGAGAIVYTDMTKIYTGASMSLDGYISGPEESGFDLLFDWYGNGDVVVETAHAGPHDDADASPARRTSGT